MRLVSLRRFRPVAVLLVVALAAGLRAAAPERFAFAALGCMPYERDDAGAVAFGRLIAEINRVAPAFTVHLGDICGGSEPANDTLFRQRRDHFDAFAGALIYTPGDNEWTDTHRTGFAPAERLAKLRELFFATERSRGAQPIPLVTQRRDTAHAAYVENARWTRGGIVFATVHVVGSSNNHAPAPAGALDEWRARDAANAAWLRATFAEAARTAAPGVALFFHADPFAEDRGRAGYDAGFELFLTTLEAEGRAFGKPVLLVHADEHRYRLDTGVRFHRDGERLANVTRLETFGAQNLHAVLVAVDPASAAVFLPGPLLVPGNALPLLPRAPAKKR